MLIKKLWKKITRKLSSRLLHKFLLLFSCVIIFSIGIQSVVSYNMLHNQSLSSEIISNSRILEFVGKELDDYMTETSRLLSSSLNYDQIMKASREEALDYQEQLVLEDYLRSIFYSRGDIAAAYLYLLDSNRFYHISRQQKETMVRISQGNDLMAGQLMERIKTSKKNWTVESLALNNSTVYELDTQNLSMAFHASVFNISTRTPRLILTVVLDTSMRNRIAEDAATDPGQQLIIRDYKEEIYYIHDTSVPSEGALLDKKTVKNSEYEIVLVEDKEYYAISAESPAGTWQLIKLLPHEQVAAAASANRKFSIFTGISSLTTALLIVYLLAKAITRPLNRLSAKMDNFSRGDFAASVPVSGNDEIAQIGEQFNLMANRTQELIRQTWQLDLAHKEALLKSLVSELNPHFLYNALQAISTEALKNNNEKIHEMIDALSKTLRYCISEDDVVPLEQEINYVEQYMTLQKARYGENKLKIYMDIDESVLSIELPKLAIQLLVENSIKHALEKTGDDIVIRIKSFIDKDKLCITVWDNGPGISADVLRKLKKTLKDPLDASDLSEIGLRNLATRLRLVFGNSAQIDIEADQKGTLVKIIIPI